MNNNRPFALGISANTAFTFAVSVFASVFCISFYSSISRPIWFDEFLHFAISGSNSTTEAWAVIRESIRGVNHGQTGIYMLIDYWSAAVFGASGLALRWPSVVSTFIFFWSAIKLIQMAGLDWPWRILAVASVCLQDWFVPFTAEARPYMPLAAAVMGTSCYYFLTRDHRTLTTRMFAALAVALGATMHPYFALYWSGIAVAFYLGHVLSANINFNIRSFIDHLDPPIVIFGSTLYFLIGASTWIGPGPKLGFNPLQWIGSDPFGAAVAAHFDFVNKTMGMIWFSCIAAALFTLMSMRCGFVLSLKKASPPMLLFAVAVAASAITGTASYMAEYWILPRQWIASIALIPVSCVWLIGTFVQNALGKNLKIISWCLALGGVLVTGTILAERASAKSAEPAPRTAAKEDVIDQVPELLGAAEIPWMHMADAHYPEASRKIIQKYADLWVDLANVNIAEGGQVWPYFREFYRQAGAIRPSGSP